MYNKRKTLIFLISTLILLIVVAGIFSIFKQQKRSENFSQLMQKNSRLAVSQVDTSSTKLPTPIIAPQIKSLELKTLFFGNTFWGRYIDDWSKASTLGFAYPFSGLNTLQKEKYNAWIAGLECPITSTYLDSFTQDDLLKFSCPIGYTQEAAKWFEAFSLANNHMDNMQEVDGLAQTRNNLEANKIQYFGHFDKSVINDICEVIALPINAKMDNEKIETRSMPIAMCGFHNVFSLPTEEQIAQISIYSKYFITVVMPHQGVEYTYTADGLQRNYARRYIYAGADIVIGDHVHSVQNVDKYKDKVIFYSLGNFIFDQQAIPQVREAIAADITWNFDYTKDLQPYLDLANKCTKFKDNCLQQAQSGNYIKPKFTQITNFVALDNSNKLTKKATPEVYSKLRNIIKWDEIMK